jgi:hypothetical protein
VLDLHCTHYSAAAVINGIAVSDAELCVNALTVSLLVDVWLFSTLQLQHDLGFSYKRAQWSAFT